MAEYIEKFARDAKYLTPPILESELVDELSQHFTPEIYDNLLMLRVDTFTELCHRLDVIQHRERNRAHIAIKHRINREYESRRLKREKPEKFADAPVHETFFLI